VRHWDGKFREPNVVFMLAEHAVRLCEQYADGADLAMEVVSDEGRRRDVETKRAEYARAGIAEYWIVDPTFSLITVLSLFEGAYVVHGEFQKGEQATSRLLPGFAVAVTTVLAPKR
jgi:Uma2 family endonuclease